VTASEARSEAVDTADLSSLQVEDFSPRLPFPQVLARLRQALSDDRLPEAIDLLLLAYRPVMAAEAHTLVHVRNLDPNTWGDEALSTVMHEVVDRLPALVVDTIPVQNLMAFLRRGTTRSWDRYLDSTGGLDGRSEMSTVHRRRMRLTTLRNRWIQQYGIPPEPNQHFLDWANTEQSKTQKDPARSGMVFTIEDLTPIQGVLSTDVDDDGLDPAGPEEPSESPLSTLDRKRLAHMVIADTDRTDPLLGAVARIMLASQATEAPGHLPSTHNIASELRIRHQRAQQLVGQVHTVAREILADRFGITGSG